VFERGFKAWCERLSLEKRKELGIRPRDPLSPSLLADNLGITVWTIEMVPGLSEAAKKILLDDDSGSWSAATVCTENRNLIILNSSHTPGRQASNLMHELAHHLLAHKPSPLEVSPTGVMVLHDYSRKQEEDADWLSACLLLPRDALVHIKRRHLEIADAAKEYGVSLSMLKYRLDVSGVNYQFT
jgi:Zn-dependent peptidase ImmA (M78 family)